MKLIAPFGFYGWGNIGDEASLQGFARLTARLEPRPSAWVGSRNPRHCRRAEPSFRYFDAAAERSLMRRWAWTTADAMVVAGGTPIGDALGAWPLSEVIPLVARAASLGIPVAFVGTGTEQLRTDGARRLVAEELSPHVTAWSVRSSRDHARLTACGVPDGAIVIAADLAWALDPVPAEPGARQLTRLGVNVDKPIIGVNVNIEHFVRNEQPRLLHELAEFLDRVAAAHDATLLFLCNEVRSGATFDLAASRELIASLRHPGRAVIVPNTYWLPQEMLSLVACCTFTVSTRYHFCLFSALQGVPMLAVERSTKVADLAADLAWPYRVALADVRAERLHRLFDEMVERRSDLRRLLEAAVPRMRERAQLNETPLTTLTTAAVPTR